MIQFLKNILNFLDKKKFWAMYAIHYVIQSREKKSAILLLFKKIIGYSKYETIDFLSQI